jgi:hypothetical protein
LLASSSYTQATTLWLPNSDYINKLRCQNIEMRPRGARTRWMRGCRNVVCAQVYGLLSPALSSIGGEGDDIALLLATTFIRAPSW